VQLLPNKPNSIIERKNVIVRENTGIKSAGLAGSVYIKKC
jgi:hypothetical protein